MNKRFLLKNTKIFDADNGSFGDDQDIFIENGLISSIGHFESVDAHNIEIFECHGKYALPGLWECHAHLFPYTLDDPEFQQMVMDEIGKLEGDSWDDFKKRQLFSFLESGVTYIRDVGGPIVNLKNLNKEIRSGKYNGPEIYYAGPLLQKSPPLQSFPGLAETIDTIENVDSVMQNLTENGASLIKTFNRLDQNTLIYLLKRAEENHLPVTHDPGIQFGHWIPVDRAMDLGIRCFEHAKSPLPVVLKTELKLENDRLIHSQDADKEIFMAKVFKMGTEAIDRNPLDELMEKMISHDIFFCPTLHCYERTRKSLPSKPQDAKEAEWLRVNLNGIEMRFLIAAELIRHGVKILVGQDGQESEHTLREMELLRECGLKEVDIIKGATLYPAQWFGFDDRMGKISENKWADIVILNENPLENIANIRSVRAVVQKGKWFEVCVTQ